MGWPSAVHKVDPLARQIGKSSEVLGRREPLRLEALTRRSCPTLSRFAADNPAHRRIVAQALGVVHILVSGTPPKSPLPQQTDQSMAAILARPGIGKNPARDRRQAECVVAFAVCQQSGIGCDNGAAKQEHQPTVETNLRAPSSDSPA